MPVKPLKRNYGIDPSNIIESAPRGKRPREDSHSPQRAESSGSIATNKLAIKETPVDKSDPQQVRSDGLRIWNAVRDARGKDNNADLSYDFMRLPSKRQYPDYYIITKHPICLEDIKQRLDNFHYPNLEAVKGDLDTCFKNARKYNVKESGIWKAAKFLQKLVNREYEALADHEEDADIDGLGDGSGREEGEEKKKKQSHSLHRSLKQRLGKLCEIEDGHGQLLSIDFMDPPDRKLYPDYYRVIKRVMCFNIIFKKIKRKEYSNVAEFSTDVDLVFRNAFQYNQDQSQIYQNAKILKDYFSKQMAGLASELVTAPATSGKIKFKLPATAAAAVASSESTEAPHASTGLTVKLPPAAAASTSSSTPAPTPAPQPKEASVSKEAPPATPSADSDAMAVDEPDAESLSQVGHTGGGRAATVTAAPSAPTAPPPGDPRPPSSPRSSTASPGPEERVPPKYPIKSVLMQTVPRGRRFHLDRAEGVRMWSLRLGPTERAVRISSICFVEGDGDETGDDAEDDAEDDGVAGRVRKGRVTRRRATETRRSGEERTEMSVRLNGIALKVEEEVTTELGVGGSVLEVSREPGGEVWKIYLDRPTGV